MNFAIILESMKFYKLKNARTVQFWFVLLYAINILIYVLPIGDKDFSRYYDAFTVMVESLSKGIIPENIALPLTAGNYIYMGMTVLVSLINAFFMLLYSALYIYESDNLMPGQVFLKSLAALPRLILLLLLMLVPAIMTACLGFLPLIIFGMMMYFLPLILIIEKSKLADAMHHSFTATQGRKLFIFVQVILISFIISLPQNLVLTFIPKSIVPVAIITSFFAVLRALIQGRLMGIFYLVIVKKVPLSKSLPPKAETGN